MTLDLDDMDRTLISDALRAVVPDDPQDDSEDGADARCRELAGLFQRAAGATLEVDATTGLLRAARFIATEDYRTLLLQGCGCVSEAKCGLHEWHPIAMCDAHQCVWDGSGWKADEEVSA